METVIVGLAAWFGLSLVLRLGRAVSWPVWLAVAFTVWLCAGGA